MSTVYFFRGQGSQAVGMGEDLFDSFGALVEKADQILGYSLKTLCLEDPDEHLNLTQYTQPALFAVNSLFMTLLGLDLISAISSVAACIGNIGPGLGSVGPAENYNHLPALGKWLLSLCMLVGRLEIYTVIVLFIPEFWKK